MEKISNVQLISVEALLGKKFLIPKYQRGYRWRKDHAETLLDDLNRFRQQLEDSKDSSRFYSMQPLVVKRHDSNARDELVKFLQGSTSLRYDEMMSEVENLFPWDVIDGQQRLTTLYLLLSYLGYQSPYAISYESREGSAEFLRELSEAKKDSEALDALRKKSETNIDYSRMFEVYQCIADWFEGVKESQWKKEKEFDEAFKKIVLHKIQFIWYEVSDEDPVKVFTRLNSGTIKLSNAELIKALVLHQNSFKEKGEQLRLVRGRIAAEWDIIEQHFQDDAFWLYLNPYRGDEDDRKDATRIDFLFDLIVSKSKLRKTSLGEGYDLFRKFEEYFRKEWKKSYGSIAVALKEVKGKGCKSPRVLLNNALWSEVSRLYHVLEEWFEDVKLYHYTGYLMSDGGKDIGGLLQAWDSAKDQDEFIDGKDGLKDMIRESIKGVCDFAREKRCSVLDVTYDRRDSLDKTKCRPLLLLHNVLTVVNQAQLKGRKAKTDAKTTISPEGSGSGRWQQIFYRFPFNLYKREKWDIEHIDPVTENQMDDDVTRKLWLHGVYSLVPEEGELRKKIEEYCRKGEDGGDFQNLRETIEKSVGQGSGERIDGDKKNRIWNFVLLDAGTNRSYKNALFPVKRRTIMFKERGLSLLKTNERLKDCLSDWEKTEASSPFVPPCTKQAFLQYYTEGVSSPLLWSKKDAEAYRKDLEDVLGPFIKVEG